MARMVCAVSDGFEHTGEVRQVQEGDYWDNGHGMVYTDYTPSRDKGIGRREIVVKEGRDVLGDVIGRYDTGLWIKTGEHRPPTPGENWLTKPLGPYVYGGATGGLGSRYIVVPAGQVVEEGPYEPIEDNVTVREGYYFKT